MRGNIPKKAPACTRSFEDIRCTTQEHVQNDAQTSQYTAACIHTTCSASAAREHKSCMPYRMAYSQAHAPAPGIDYVHLPTAKHFTVCMSVVRSRSRTQHTCTISTHRNCTQHNHTYARSHSPSSHVRITILGIFKKRILAQKNIQTYFTSKKRINMLKTYQLASLHMPFQSMLMVTHTCKT